MIAGGLSYALFSQNDAIAAQPPDQQSTQVCQQGTFSSVDKHAWWKPVPLENCQGQSWEHGIHSHVCCVIHQVRHSVIDEVVQGNSPRQGMGLKAKIAHERCDLPHRLQEGRLMQERQQHAGAYA